MKNYVQAGDVITVAAPYQRNSGEGALIGDTFGVACDTVANGVVGDFRTVGVFDLVKVGSQAWTVGALIYWDDTNKRCTTVSTGNRRIGSAMLAVGSGAGELVGRVRLSGAPAPAGA
jgi:predicted RecA/RadA family phage recombinase